MKYVLLYAAIIANILTNVGFNFSAIYDKDPVKKWGFLAIGLVFGLINSVLFTESLKSIPLQVASAIFFSVTIVGLFLVSYFYFNEHVTPMRIAGVFVITLGVIMVSLERIWTQKNQFFAELVEKFWAIKYLLAYSFELIKRHNNRIIIEPRTAPISPLNRVMPSNPET